MKLTLNDAIRIRVEVKYGATAEEMAERYRIPLAQVQGILNRHSYSTAHITRELRRRRFGLVEKPEDEVK